MSQDANAPLPRRSHPSPAHQHPGAPRHRPTNRRHILRPLLAAALTTACADFDAADDKPLPSPCCDCIVDHQCSSWTRKECGEWIHGSRSGIKVSYQCLDQNGCWPLCAAEDVTRGG